MAFKTGGESVKESILREGEEKSEGEKEGKKEVGTEGRNGERRRKREREERDHVSLDYTRESI